MTESTSWSWNLKPDPGRELTAQTLPPFPDAPGEVFIVWHVDEKFVPFGDGLAIPQRFWGDWFLAWGVRVLLEIVLEEGRLVCQEVRVRRGKAGGMDTAAMRSLNLSGLIDATAAAASFVRTDEGKYEIWASRDTDTVGLWRESVSRTPRRGKAISDDELQRVADIYRAANARRKPPTAAVAREMNVPRSTAAKWVMKARERDLLEPATRPSGKHQQAIEEKRRSGNAKR